MAYAKCGHEYDVAIAHALYIGGLFSGKFNPLTSNPYKLDNVPATMNEEQRKESLDMGVKALGQALHDMYGKRVKKQK